jgi:hypothetical protein
MDIVKEISKKGFDAAKIACYAIENPQCIGQLIEGVMAPKGSVRFGYEKVLRLISEQHPELVYPYFSVFTELSVCDNSFLKWGAILIISNLAVVDLDNKFDAIFTEYYAPVTGPVMITAANIIRSSAKIAAAKPYLTQRITREILRVETARFELHGEPSPECRNVAIGHAIDAFDQFFDQIEEPEIVIKFVERQRMNSRKPAVKKAENFLNKHRPQK